MRRAATLTAEPLESREVPAITLNVEYGAGFFADPGARQTFGGVAGLYAAALTGPAVTIRVDAAPLGGDTLGLGSPRGITFDADTNWHFGSSTVGLDPGEFDFYSVAVHELGHVLGVGTSPRWFEQVADGRFTGEHSREVYGEPVPLAPGNAHWREGIRVNGATAAYDPQLSPGARQGVSALDAAALRDLGWSVDAGLFVAPVGPPADPFPGYAGAVSIAHGDVTGDGVPDWVAGTLTASSHVKVLDGSTGRTVRSFLAFEAFNGGVAVGAADGRIVVAAQHANGHVKAFAAGSDQPVLSVLAFEGYRGTVALAPGELRVTADNGRVKRFDPITGEVLESTLAG